MAHPRYCLKCGNLMVSRPASPEATKAVQAITGQKFVNEYKCPKCYPNQIADFLGKKPLK